MPETPEEQLNALQGHIKQLENRIDVMSGHIELLREDLDKMFYGTDVYASARKVSDMGLLGELAEISALLRERLPAPPQQRAGAPADSLKQSD